MNDSNVSSKRVWGSLIFTQILSLNCTPMSSKICLKRNFEISKKAFSPLESGHLSIPRFFCYFLCVPTKVEYLFENDRVRCYLSNGVFRISLSQISTKLSAKQIHSAFWSETFSIAELSLFTLFTPFPFLLLNLI